MSYVVSSPSFSDYWLSAVLKKNNKNPQILFEILLDLHKDILKINLSFIIFKAHLVTNFNQNSLLYKYAIFLYACSVTC